MKTRSRNSGEKPAGFRLGHVSEGLHECPKATPQAPQLSVLPTPRPLGAAFREATRADLRGVSMMGQMA